MPRAGHGSSASSHQLRTEDVTGRPGDDAVYPRPDDDLPMPRADGVPPRPADDAHAHCDVGYGLPEGAQLAGLVATLREVDGLMARAVRHAREIDGRRAVAEEGMTVEAAARLHTGQTRSDLFTVLNAADVLAHMPVTATLFDRGVLSWGHVRALVAGARAMDRHTRGALDEHLAANAARLERLDSDGRLAVIDDAIVHHTPVGRVEASAEREAQRRLLVLSPRLDGSGTLFGDLDAEGFATVTGRIQAEAETPLAAPSPGDGDVGLPGYARQITARSRGWLLADALVRICAGPTSGRGGVPVRFVVTLDTDQLTDMVAGTIRPALAARAPRLVRRAIDRLACDAALDVVLRDGTDLLAAQRYAPEVTAATRRAVTSRDEGCRFPGCRAPVTWCDIHHVTPRIQTAAAGGNPNGDHAVSNLVLLCRRHHTITHRRGWQQTLQPDGTYHLRRHGRHWTTYPRNLTGPAPPRTSQSRDGPDRHRRHRGPPSPSADLPTADPAATPDPPTSSDPPLHRNPTDPSDPLPF